MSPTVHSTPAPCTVTPAMASYVAHSRASSPAPSETPTKRTASFKTPDSLSLKFVHDQCHQNGPSKAFFCIFCVRRTIETGESSGTQEVNAEISGQPSGAQIGSDNVEDNEDDTKTSGMSQVSSQASGEDMSRAESSSTNHTTTTSASISLAESRRRQDKILQDLENHLPEPVMIFPPQEELWYRLRKSAKQRDIIEQTTKMIHNDKLCIAEVKDTLKIGHVAGQKCGVFEIRPGGDPKGLRPTSWEFMSWGNKEKERKERNFSKKLDPTSKEFVCEKHLPLNGFSDKGLLLGQRRVEILTEEWDRVLFEGRMFEMMWMKGFKFPVLEEGYLAPDRNGHLKEWLQSQPPHPRHT